MQNVQTLTDQDLVEIYGDPNDLNYGSRAYPAQLRFHAEVDAYINANPKQAQNAADIAFDTKVRGLPSPRPSERLTYQYTVGEAPTEMLQAKRFSIIRAAAARKVRGAVPDSSYLAAIRAIDAVLADRQPDPVDPQPQRDPSEFDRFPHSVGNGPPRML